MKTTLLTAMLGLGLWAVPTAAEAAQYTICVRLPVTLADQTGAANEIGLSTPVIGSGGWVARGIEIDHVDRVGVGPVANVPDNANSNGCFTMEAAGGAQYNVFVRSTGNLADSNTLIVSNSSGTPSLYSALINLPAGGGTFNLYWPQENILLRMYAILAYAINEGYRGRFDAETLHAWWYPDNAVNTACGSDCLNCADTINGNLGHICIQDNSDQRKFLITHEYGHINLSLAISNVGSNSCGYGNGEPPGSSSSWHSMRSIERNSCAFSEAWAHFVAADTWNDDIHAGGDPAGSFRYWGSGSNTVIDLEAGQGGCGGPTGGDNNYRLQFGDVCWAADPNCSGGDCDGYGVELDWLRTLWDYHTDGDLPGSIPDHVDLHDHIEAAGSWGSTNFWDQLMGGLVGTNDTRMQTAANANGTSEP